MTYRLRLLSGSKVYHEVFREDLGSLHLFAENNGYYGQRVVIHETVEALDGYEELGVVDSYYLTYSQPDHDTGDRRPLRARVRA